MLGFAPKKVVQRKDLGLFRKISASIALGELWQDIRALRQGETHPLLLFLDQKNKIVFSPDFKRLYRKILL
jgi:hypothetical protein